MSIGFDRIDIVFFMSSSGHDISAWISQNDRDTMCGKTINFNLKINKIILALLIIGIVCLFAETVSNSQS